MSVYSVYRRGVIQPGIACVAIVTNRSGMTTAYFQPPQTDLSGLQVFRGLTLVWSYSTPGALTDLAPANDLAAATRPGTSVVTDSAYTVETAGFISPARQIVVEYGIVYDSARARGNARDRSATDMATLVDVASPTVRAAQDLALAVDAA